MNNDQIESLRRQLADEKLCHEETRERIAELEAVIRSHGIPVKTYAGGEAHYCTKEEPTCNPHPDAPHGFCRDASHSAGRYVCECEGWEPDEYDDLITELDRLSRIEDVAMEVIMSEVWSGDEFYDKLCKLKETLWSTW